MRAFILVDLLFVAGLLYLITNLIRYAFFKTSRGGGFFGLSDAWLKETNKKQKEKDNAKS